MLKRSLVILLSLLSWSCDRPSSAGGAAASASAARSAAKPPIDDEPLESVDDQPDPSADSTEPDDSEESSDEDPNDACAPPDAKLKPLQLLRFTFSERVKGKDPAGKLQVARPGQRVYAHFRMRNRSGRKRCMKLTFRVGGKKRTEVTLAVGKSWNWRTWAYNTLKSDDRGPLSLEVVDDQNKLILNKSLAVVAE